MTQGQRLDRASVIGLAAMAVTLLFMLGKTLYTFPIPDSSKWFGDESWLMLEARTQITEGVLRHPYALGATINHSVGIFGITWIASLIYGLPAAIFKGQFPIISIGRTVTFVVGLLSLFEVFRLTLRSTHRVWFAMFVVVIIASSPAFTLAVHRARPDLLVGLVVLLVVGYFAKCTDTHYDQPQQWMLFGSVMTLLGLTVSLHLVTLLAPFALFVMWQKDAFRKPIFALSAFAGAAITSGILALIYYLTAGDLSLFGTHGQHVQFLDIANEKPILRLFSRSVQWNNLTERIELLWNGIPALVVLFALTALKIVIDLIRRKATYFKNSEIRFTTITTLIIFISWLLFQTSIEYYIPHFLLLAVYTTAFLFDAPYLKIMDSSGTSTPISLALVLCGLFLTAMQLARLNKADEIGKILETDNHRAESQLFARIRSDAAQAGDTHPLVLAETPCTLHLETETDFRIMNPLFVSFPERTEPLFETLRRYGAKYAILFGHPSYRPTFWGGDSTESVVLDRAVGTFYDIEQDYNHFDSRSLDTMTLYKINTKR